VHVGVFCEVSEMVFFILACDDYLVDIGENVATHLALEYF
jgi:hypothetical protein